MRKGIERKRKKGDKEDKTETHILQYDIKAPDSRGIFLRK